VIVVTKIPPAAVGDPLLIDSPFTLLIMVIKRMIDLK